LDDTPLSELTKREIAWMAGVHQRVKVLRLTVEPGQSGTEVRAHRPHDLLNPVQMGRDEHQEPVIGDEP
jgi:hypothetical protein